MNDGTKSSRRTFLSEASKVTAAGLVAGEAVLATEEKKADVLRIGLIGCGGRGSGAVTGAVATDSNVQLVAMADVFRDKLDASSFRDQKSETIWSMGNRRQLCFSLARIPKFA